MEFLAGGVPTFCFSSASNAGNMVLLYGVRKTSQSHRHPATALARFPEGQLITQEKLKNQNRTMETPADVHHAHPLLPQPPRDFRKPCHFAPFFLPTASAQTGRTRLAVPLRRPGGAPEELGRATRLPAFSRGARTLAGPMLSSPQAERCRKIVKETRKVVSGWMEKKSQRPEIQGFRASRPG